jgi:hypothetical protein
MGKKSSSKGLPPQPVPPQEPARKSGALMYVAIAVLVAGVAGFALWGGGDPGATASTETATAADASKPNTPPSAVTASAEAEAAAQAVAAIGPHKQAALPPIPFQGYAPPRAVSVVTAAYEFAAEHPEILSYVPCFCGCERAGHRGNHDCFVKARAANGDVVEWEPHGLECAVCIDVATRSRQMHASGASVRDIRTAIEKEFVPTSPVITPTPKPPAHDH